MACRGCVGCGEVDWSQVDWEQIRERARELDSDGCTRVTQLYQDCCFLHDILWRTGEDLHGNRVDFATADRLKRDCIRYRSRFGRYSPLALWRHAGLRLFGRFFRPKDS